MSWTEVPKPTGDAWQAVSLTGKEIYDDPAVIYDDPMVFYDGMDTTSWTSVAKPTGGQEIFAGYATGIITPPTYSRSYGADPWVKIPKPN